jgi:tetratricopeptide (TPR) repeat protein
VEWADRVNGDRAQEYEEILGYHLEQAYRYLLELAPADDHARDIGADAARRLISAGRRARERGDLAAAANLLERAAAVLPELDTRRLQVLPELGETLADLGRFDAARAVLDTATDGARAADDPALGAHAMLMRLLLQLGAGEVEQWTELAGPQIEVAIEVFTKTEDHLGLAKAYRVLGFVHGTACQYGAAAEANERALEHARIAGDPTEERFAATSYALCACLGPTPVDDAVGRCEAILQDVRHNRISSGWVLCLLANLWAMRGDFERARRAYGDGRAAIQEVAGEGWHLAWSARMASRVEMLAGDPATAERLLRDAAALLERTGERYLLSTVTALLARAVLALGRTSEAAALTVRAEELTGADDVESQAEWRAARAKVRAREGRLDEAARLAQDALQLLLPTDSVVMTIDTLRELGDVFSEIGDPSASWAYREALALAERKGDSVAAADARELLRGIEPAVTAAE